MSKVGDELIRPILRALDDLPVRARYLGDLFRGLKGKQRTNRDGVDEVDVFDGGGSPGSSPNGPERGVDRGDGRDHLGHYANGQESKPWVDKEKLGLQHYAEDNDVDVITTQVRVDYDGSPQSGRRYDGLVRNTDGPNTYDGIEIKSGNAIDHYLQPGNTQQQFDNTVNGGTPARGRLDGDEIMVTRVIIREEP